MAAESPTETMICPLTQVASELLYPVGGLSERRVLWYCECRVAKGLRPCWPQLEVSAGAEGGVRGGGVDPSGGPGPWDK